MSCTTLMTFFKRLLRLLGKPIPHTIKDKIWCIALRLRYQLHTKLGEHPALLAMVYSLFKVNTDYVVNETTDLVIDAFPRSGSTFVYYAFYQAHFSTYPEAPPPSVAYHLHVPAHIMLACHLKIPTLVIIRDPKDAVSSAVVREPHLRVKDYLKRYLSFYQKILPYREQIVVAQFEEATQELDKLIARINQKFATQFAVFAYEPNNIEQVKQQMSVRLTQIGGQEHQSYLPNKAKEEAKEKIDFTKDIQLLAACKRIYNEYQHN